MGTNVKLAIQKFVNKTIKNKDGIIFQTVADDKKNFVENFLMEYHDAFITLFESEKLATKLFIDRLNKIDAIRFDDKDQNLMPLKFAFDDMKKICNGKLEGGLFKPMYGDGIVILEMDNIQNQKGQKELEAKHTLIHELTHGMTMFEVKEKGGKKHWQIGVNHKGNKIAYRMNEGFTEIISQKLWKKMYPQIVCPGIGRYLENVIGVEGLLDVIGNKEQVIEDYIICGESVLNQMKLYEDFNGDDLYTFIMSFNDKNLGDIQVQKQLINGIKNFNNKISTDEFQF